MVNNPEVDSQTGLIVPRHARHQDERKTWQCPKGHRYTGIHPFRVQIVVDDKTKAYTSALCPTCFKGWLERQFKTSEVKAALKAPIMSLNQKPVRMPVRRRGDRRERPRGSA